MIRHVRERVPSHAPDVGSVWEEKGKVQKNLGAVVDYVEFFRRVRMFSFKDIIQHIQQVSQSHCHEHGLEKSGSGLHFNYGPDLIFVRSS